MVRDKGSLNVNTSSGTFGEPDLGDEDVFLGDITTILTSAQKSCQPPIKRASRVKTLKPTRYDPMHSRPGDSCPDSWDRISTCMSSSATKQGEKGLFKGRTARTGGMAGLDHATPGRD